MPRGEIEFTISVAPVVTAYRFLDRAARNPHVHLAATAVASGAVVASAILSYQRLQRQKRVAQLQELKDAIRLGDDGERVSLPPLLSLALLIGECGRVI